MWFRDAFFAFVKDHRTKVPLQVRFSAMWMCYDYSKVDSKVEPKLSLNIKYGFEAKLENDTSYKGFGR
jgi:hypothetical protein